MGESSNDEFEAYIDSVSEESIEKLLHNFNRPLPSGDDASLNLLTEHYGPVDKWDVDHWKYMNVMLVIVLKDQGCKYKNSQQARTSFYKAQQKLKDESDALQVRAAEIIGNEDLSLDEKSALIETMKTKHNKILTSLETLKEELNENVVGRPKRPEGIFKYLDYMVKELGSVGKAVLYMTEHPVWRPSNSESLKREYRKYRKANRGG